MGTASHDRGARRFSGGTSVKLRTARAAHRRYRKPMMNAADTTRTRGTAAVAALGTGIVLALITIAVTVTSPATIPLWCAAHGGCP
jgi:hypothetical protein